LTVPTEFDADVDGKGDKKNDGLNLHNEATHVILSGGHYRYLLMEDPYYDCELFLDALFKDNVYNPTHGFSLANLTDVTLT
jgi:hypothetical protein